MVKCPKEWHNNSVFYAICNKGFEFDEYCYVITKKAIPFDDKKQVNAWTLFTLKDGSQIIGHADGYADSQGKMIRFYNCETKAMMTLASKKIVTMQKGRALLPPVDQK